MWGTCTPATHADQQSTIYRRCFRWCCGPCLHIDRLCVPPIYLSSNIMLSLCIRVLCVDLCARGYLAATNATDTRTKIRQRAPDCPNPHGLTFILCSNFKGAIVCHRSLRSVGCKSSRELTFCFLGGSHSCVLDDPRERLLADCCRCCCGRSC